MDESTDKQMRRIADNLERIADYLEKLTRPGLVATDERGVSVDPPPPPVRTS